jgi:hypothetical protein
LKKNKTKPTIPSLISAHLAILFLFLYPRSPILFPAHLSHAARLHSASPLTHAPLTGGAHLSGPSSTLSVRLTPWPRRPHRCPAPPRLPAPPPLPSSARSTQPSPPQAAPPLLLPKTGAPPSPPALMAAAGVPAAHCLARASSSPLSTYKSRPEHLSTSHRSLELFSSSAPPPQGSSPEQGPAGRTSTPICTTAASSSPSSSSVKPPVLPLYFGVFALLISAR